MSIMASKTVKQLITTGGGESNSVKVLLACTDSGANRLMSAKKIVLPSGLLTSLGFIRMITFSNVSRSCCVCSVPLKVLRFTLHPWALPTFSHMFGCFSSM